ncbi:MAG: hypothetical protein QM756_11055 [Polyangiaceae bacterium]
MADRVDPPRRLEQLVGEDNAAIIARSVELADHMRAGRIRKRRGESDRELALRVARGDFGIVASLIDFKQARASRAKGAT